MFQTFQHPRIHLWQGRLTRLRAMPRWGWIAVMVGVVLPLVVLVAGFFLVALVSAVAVFMVVAIIMGITNSVRRLLHGTRDDGRRNVKIVVHSARVMDP